MINMDKQAWKGEKDGKIQKIWCLNTGRNGKMFINLVRLLFVKNNDSNWTKFHKVKSCTIKCV